MYTNDELLQLALDGTYDERALAREVIEERGERYELNRRLIDALQRIEALEKKGPSSAPMPLVFLNDTDTITFPKDVVITPECTCNKPLCMVPPYPPCPVHGRIPYLKVTCESAH